MDEFTVSTNNQQDKNETSLSESKKEILNRLKDKVEKSDQTSKFKTTNSKKRLRFKLPCLNLIFVLFIILLSGYIGYMVRDKNLLDRYLNNQNQEEEDSELSDNRRSELQREQTSKYFYFIEENILKKADNNLENKEIVYEPESTISNLSKVDENLIGFCEWEKESDCTLKTYNIPDNKQNVVLETGDEVEQVAWIDQKTFVYEVNEEETKKIKFYKDNEIQIVREFSFKNGERKEFVEDHKVLSFSPDKNYFLYENTFILSGLNFNVYIFDKDGDEVEIVKNATMPVWKDDEVIIYRKYSNDEQGFLYEKEISKEASKFEKVSKTSYDPDIIANQIVYWESKNKGVIHKYDFEKDEDVLIKENYVYPKFIAKDEILAVSTYDCKQDCNDSDYDPKIELYKDEVVKINIETNEILDLGISPEVFQNGLVYL